MKKIVLLLIFSMVAYFLYESTKENKKKFSPVALNETLLDINDKQVIFNDILKKHNGKVIILEIWASWCSDCVKALPDFKELQSKHPEVDCVFISMDENIDSWKNAIKKHNLKGDHFKANDQMSGAFAKAIDLDWIPRYIILDKTGKIILYRAIEKDFEIIHKKLTELK